MTTKTNDEMIGEITREVAQLEALIKSYCEPLKEKIKAKHKAIERLLLEDGRQQVDVTLLWDDGKD